MARYERQEKPYNFVKISDLDDKARHRPSEHSIYHANAISGTIHGEVKALSPVHVASGRMELTGNNRTPLIKTHTKCNGRIIIPGSSLKGCIRSIVEAISNSCVSITRAYSDQLPFRTTACRNEKELCIACRLFGSMGYLGKVRFSDAVLQGEFKEASIPQLFSPRSRQEIYLDKDGKVKGRKFYKHGAPASGETPIEICPIDSRLNFTLDFDDLTKAELGLLLVAMGQGETKLCPKLGGAKPACYGTIEISLTKSQVFEDMKNVYLQYDAKPASVNVAECVTAAEDLILDEQLEELARILKVDGGRECPGGNY